MRKRLTDIIGWSECGGKKENLYSISSLTLRCIRKNEEDYPNAYEGAHEYLGRKEAEAMVITKLGKYEDIDEKLGIDLITLFKALKNGAWFVDWRNKNKFFAMCTLCSKIDGKFECAQEEMKFNGFIVLDQLFGLGHELKDYGKTWALTKEELE